MTKATPSKTVSLISEKESIRIDEADENTIYQGWASLGAGNSESKWKIKKIYTGGNITSVLWAGGNVNYDKVWNDRALYDYS